MVLSADESVLKVTKLAMGAEFKASTVTQQFTQMIQVNLSMYTFGLSVFVFCLLVPWGEASKWEVGWRTGGGGQVGSGCGG